MSVQYTDGSFSPTEPFCDALETFNEALEDGTARALYVGTENEINQIKEKQNLKDQIKELSARIEKIEGGPVKSDIIIIPTRDEVIASNRFDCGGKTMVSNGG